ncbi:MAG: apolipoprotein N-acyltransferase [Chlamydiota bacterium]
MGLVKKTFSGYTLKKIILSLLSFVIIAFGQPALLWWMGPIAASIGFALFWLTTFDVNDSAVRFFRGLFWFFSVQLVQLYWFVSHPYAYIYPVYLGLCLMMGIQFGLLTSFVTREKLTALKGIVAVAAFWVVMEWSRLFILSGFSWNPVGLYLSTTFYGIQFASLFGVYGMSFCVILANILALRLIIFSLNKGRAIAFAVCVMMPYGYGVGHYMYHNASNRSDDSFNVVLAQTAFPVEEALGINSTSQFVAYVIDEWEQILSITKKNIGQDVNLVVLPEFVVPLGTYTFIYPYETVKSRFERQYGTENLKHLPLLKLPFAKEIQTANGKAYFVNNAYWAQAIANTFDAPILLGLEDVDEVGEGEMEYYSAAVMIQPNKELASHWPYESQRYEKRVLVPMGEYIPFEFCKELAKSYGVQGSFTCGKEAKVLNGHTVPIGVSICYEETFGNLIRESRKNGAEVFVNLTSDVWYPDSTLTSQHLEHARLRTVESGVPLIRSCNTGITCGIDSFGRTVDFLEEYDVEGHWNADSLYTKVPKYHYKTLYTEVGDGSIIGFCAIAITIFLCSNRKKKKFF